MFRNAGWTWAECREQPAKVVFGLLKHLAQHPPCYLILAAVHLKPKTVAELDQESVNDMQGMFGPVQPMPDSVCEALRWMDNFGKPNEG